MKQQRAYLVAVQQLDALRRADADAHAIAIRVGGNADIGPQFFSQLYAQFHRLGQLRIGAGRRGELSVRVLLLSHHADAQFRQACEHPAHRPVARAVKRRIDHMQLFRRQLNASFQHRLMEGIPHVAPDGAHHALVRVFLIIGQAGHQILVAANAGCHVHGRVVIQLAACAVIHLDAIVFAGIVAGRDHDTAVAAQIAHRETEDRRWHQLFKQMNPHAKLRHHGCHQPGILA